MADPDIITPEQGAQALRTTLEMAEMHQQWRLLRETLRYIKEAGGVTARLGPSDYLIQYPKE